MAESSAYEACQYEVLKGSSGGNLRCGCGNCPNGANLKDARCLPRVLTSLDREFGISSITLSHHIETEYVNDSMDLLERMLTIRRLIERMSGRSPEPLNKVTTACVSCNLNPETLFKLLSGRFIADQGRFHSEFLKATINLNRGKGANCRKCVGRTKSDFLFLSGYLLPFWRWVQSRGDEP